MMFASLVGGSRFNSARGVKFSPRVNFLLKFKALPTNHYTKKEFSTRNAFFESSKPKMIGWLH